MNGHFSTGNEIYRLSEDEAQNVLQAFLEMGRNEFPNMRIDAVNLNFSQKSVSLALRHIAQAELQSGDDKFFNLWSMRLGYYFGEALCRASNRLSWGIGELNSAFENHPVIRGFGSGEEAAVITICMNVILAVAIDGAPASRIDEAVDHWFEMAKN
ncbi:hypothetical protein [Sphingomonas gilva]|uniref:hypothetical protein n=1 Tax=Sphingomonas gilva TaxID=2305907 RepID=UPI0011C47EE3|nr:hypothetical protein [Sphingomonas gilva]